MSRIDDLIKRYAPDGIQYKTLDEALPTRLGGYWGVEAGAADMSAYAIRNGDVGATGRLRWGALPLRGFTEKEYAKARVRAGDVAMTTSGNCGNVGYIRDEPTEPTVATNFVRILRGDPTQLDSRFTFHFLRSAHFTTKMLRFVRGGAMQNLSVNEAFKAITIPVPPLEIQREIVRILDAFTELEAELEAELETRAQQYTHYRDRLLTFAADGSVPWLPIGDTVKIVRGASPRPIQRFLTDSHDGVPWIKIGDVAAGGKYITATAQRVTPAGAAKSRRIFPGDFVLSNSMSFGRPYISKIEGCIHDGWLGMSAFGGSYLPDFLFHLLSSTPIQAEFVRKAGDGGAVSNLNSEIVKSVVVPVPPLDQQSQIVEILDKFDALVNDSSSGLPAEIAARRQQHAYYRDRLLTFEGAGA